MGSHNDPEFPFSDTSVRKHLKHFERSITKREKVSLFIKRWKKVDFQSKDTVNYQKKKKRKKEKTKTKNFLEN